MHGAMACSPFRGPVAAHLQGYILRILVQQVDGPPRHICFDLYRNAEVFGTGLLDTEPGPVEATGLLEPRLEIPQAA